MPFGAQNMLSTMRGRRRSFSANPKSSSNSYRKFDLSLLPNAIFSHHVIIEKEILIHSWNKLKKRFKHRLEISWSMHGVLYSGWEQVSHLSHDAWLHRSLAHCRLMKLDSHTQKTTRVHEATAAHDVYIASSFPSRQELRSLASRASMI